MIAYFKENCTSSMCVCACVCAYILVYIYVIVTLKQAVIACRKYTYMPQRQATKEVGAEKEREGQKTDVLARFMNLSSSTFKGTITRFYFTFFLFFHRALFARFTEGGSLIKGYLKVAATIRGKVFPLESRNKASRAGKA